MIEHYYLLPRGEDRDRIPEAVTAWRLDAVENGMLLIVEANEPLMQSAADKNSLDVGFRYLYSKKVLGK